MSKGSVTRSSTAAQLVRDFVNQEKGNVAVMASIMLLPLMFMSGVTVDYTNIKRLEAELQHTADSAALFAVKEIERIGFNQADPFEQAENALIANYDHEDEDVTMFVDHQNQVLSVVMETNYEPAFMKLAGYESVEIAVETQVQYGLTYGDPRCILSLNRQGKGVVSLNGNAAIEAPNCAVHVNSSSIAALDLNGSGTSINASEVCVVGKVDSGFSRISPTPEEDCAPVDDPFDEYPRPSVGICDFTDHKVQATGNRAVHLQPGTYCGGINISANAEVVFEPGLYIIEDGALKTTGNTHLTGDGVTFFFTGYDSALELSGGTEFQLTAMNSGELAGFLIYFDPDAKTDRTSSFSGNSETFFEGILYFAENDVEINGEGMVNQDSPYSVMVANTIILNGNATIFMSVDPSETDLNVPLDINERELALYISK